MTCCQLGDLDLCALFTCLPLLLLGICCGAGDDCLRTCGFEVMPFAFTVIVLLAVVFALPTSLVVITVQCRPEELLEIWAYVMASLLFIDVLANIHMAVRTNVNKVELKKYPTTNAERRAVVDERHSHTPQVSQGGHGFKQYPATDAYLILPIDSWVAHRDLADGTALDLAGAFNTLFFFIAPLLQVAMLTLGHIGMSSMDMMQCRGAGKAAAVGQNSTSITQELNNNGEAFYTVMLVALVFGWMMFVWRVLFVLPPLLAVDVNTGLNELGRSRERGKIRQEAFLHSNPQFTNELPLQQLPNDSERKDHHNQKQNQIHVELQTVAPVASEMKRSEDFAISVDYVDTVEETQREKQDKTQDILEQDKREDQTAYSEELETAKYLAKGAAKSAVFLGGAVFSAAKWGVQRAFQSGPSAQEEQAPGDDEQKGAKDLGANASEAV